MRYLVFFLVSLFSTSVSAQPTNYMDWWKFENDVLSEGPNDGTLISGTFVPGQTGQGLDDPRVEVGQITLPLNVTVNAWVWADSFPGTCDDPRIIADATSPNEADHIFALTTVRQPNCQGAMTNIRARFCTDGTTDTLIGTPVTLNQWHMVTFTYDGAFARLYLDTVQVASIEKTGIPCSAASELTIGNMPQGGKQWDGIIDEVKIDDAAWTQEEIDAEFGGSPPLPNTVNNQAELLAALALVTGGETITLMPANYGTVSLSNEYADYVTLKSDTPFAAVFNDLDFVDAGYIKLDGVAVNNLVRADDSHHLTYLNSFLKGAYFFDSTDILVDGNEITNPTLKTGLVFDNATNFVVSNNNLHHFRSDIIQIVAASSFGVIENNTLFDVAPLDGDHPDSIQMFGRGGVGTPHDITIRGNHIYDDPSTGIPEPMQGPFISDPNGVKYTNILIEQNLIAVRSPNSLYINGCECVIQGNSFALTGNARITDKNPVSGGNEGTVIQNNVLQSVSDETLSPITIVTNYLYSTDPSDPNYRQNFYQGDGEGDDWQDFDPIPQPVACGSPYGAQARLTELGGC